MLLPAAIASLVSPPSVRSMPQVLERMRAIDAALPVTDGVAWFNKLYLRMTEEVAEALAGRFFADAAFVRLLDVVFANLYFRAVAHAAGAPTRVPRAWIPLLEMRQVRTIAPIQFALAGMNAHINRDLPVALVDTSARLGVPLDDDHHDDYLRVNAILASTQEEVKRWFATGFTGVVDVTFGHVDDVVASWSIGRARDAAWVNAQTLALLNGVPGLADTFLATLDKLVGFAGRGLLVPTAV